MEEVKRSEIIVFLTHILGIPEQESFEYDKVLKDRGYENVSNLIHFINLEDTKTIMKPDDFIKIEEYFQK